MFWGRTLFGVTLASGVFACGERARRDPPPPPVPEDLVSESVLQQAESRWSAAQVQDYELVVEQNCFCETGPHTDARVTVLGGKIASALGSMEEMRHSVDLSASDYREWFTVPGQFAVIHRALGKADRITGEFDELDGHPMRVQISWAQGTDTLEQYTIPAFAALDPAANDIAQGGATQLEGGAGGMGGSETASVGDVDAGGDTFEEPIDVNGAGDGCPSEVPSPTDCGEEGLHCDYPPFDHSTSLRTCASCENGSWAITPCPPPASDHDPNCPPPGSCAEEDECFAPAGICVCVDSRWSCYQ